MPSGQTKKIDEEFYANRTSWKFFERNLNKIRPPFEPSRDEARSILQTSILLEILKELQRNRP
jgi:hypothetical protein